MPLTRGTSGNRLHYRPKDEGERCCPVCFGMQILSRLYSSTQPGRMPEKASSCKASCCGTDSTAVGNRFIKSCHAVTEDAMWKPKAEEKYLTPSPYNDQAGSGAAHAETRGCQDNSPVMPLLSPSYSGVCTDCGWGSCVAATTGLTNLLNPCDCIQGQGASKGTVWYCGAKAKIEMKMRSFSQGICGC